MSKHLQLRVLFDSGEEQTHELAVGAAITVGRDRSTVDVHVSELYCSRNHLRIERPAASRVVVHDLGSRTGSALATGVTERLDVARRLARVRAELRIVHAELIATVGRDGWQIVPIGGLRLLQSTSALIPTDALVIIPGAIILVDHGRADTTQVRGAPQRSPARIAHAADQSWEALSEVGLEARRLTDLSLQESRALLPVLGHLDLFQDGARIPGIAADVSGASFAMVLRRLADTTEERAFVPVDLILRGVGGGPLTPRTGAVVRRDGEVRYVERGLQIEADIDATHAVLRGWLADPRPEARDRGAAQPGDRGTAGSDGAEQRLGRGEREPYAIAVTTGREVTLLESAETLARFASQFGLADHVIDVASDRPMARCDGGRPAVLTPAEVSILLAYVARALGDGRAMRPESFPNPFSATPSGRKHAFKTMRMKTDVAAERGRYRLLPTMSTALKGGTEYAFAPRSGVTYAVFALWVDYERARAWLRETPP